ncbi:transposase [Streptomyces sp. MMG1121]|uniref:transposase n=1 Tax=Streptomyces sp. MMG1121 TaxID=1415544 RepID=UPI00099CB669
MQCYARFSLSPPLPFDTSVAEWALLEPLLPVQACQNKTDGHPEKRPRRKIVDGIHCIVDNGAKRRALSADFPPWETDYGFLEVEPGQSGHLHP